MLARAAFCQTLYLEPGLRRDMQSYVQAVYVIGGVGAARYLLGRDMQTYARSLYVISGVGAARYLQEATRQARDARYVSSPSVS